MLLALLACVSVQESPAGDCDLPAVAGESGRVAGFTEAHNLVREGVGVAPLVWDEALIAPAAGWLRHLIEERDCALEHDMSSPLGENLGWNRGFENNACHVVDEWAEEEEGWDHEANECRSGQCGHWTQIVWSTTTHLGCAMDFCADGAEIWMCVYDPAGNAPGVAPY